MTRTYRLNIGYKARGGHTRAVTHCHWPPYWGGGARFLVPSPVVFDVLLVLKVQLCTLVGSLVEGSRGRGCQPKHTTAVLHPPPLPYPPHTSAFTFL